MWTCFITKTKTGEVIGEFDIPSFSWELSLDAQGFETTEDEGFEEGTASGIELPWGAVPGDTYAEKLDSIQTGKRALVLCWVQDGETHPVLWGVVGDRTDTYFGTSFELESIWDVFSNRYVVMRSGVGENAEEDTSTYSGGTEALENMGWDGYTYRGLAAKLGRACTSLRTYGELPIDWQYMFERGDNGIKTEADTLESQTLDEAIKDISNMSDIFEQVNVENSNLLDTSSLREKRYGPDMTFRPYINDYGKVRLKFEAGTDEGIYIDGETVRVEEYNDLQVQHSQPTERIYCIGESENNYYDEDEQVEDSVYLKGWAQDLSWCEGEDAYPLREGYLNIESEDWSTRWNADDSQLWMRICGLRARAELGEEAVPLAQVSFEVSAYDLPLGEVWPGDCIEVPIYGFPSLPDDDYTMRIATMQGDQTDRVTITCDVIEDPCYSTD